MILWVALRALGRNKLRSALTMLGVVIGVGAVIAMVAVGQGARASVQDTISRLGTNVLFAMAGSVTRGGVRTGVGGSSHLTEDDARAIERDAPAVSLVAPGVRTSAQVVYSNRNWFTLVTGTSPTYPVIRDWPLASGKFFTQKDINAAAKVVVIGKTVVDNLFDGVDPVGKVVRIKKVPFWVIGVFTPKGQGGMGQDQDDAVFIPYTTAMKRIMGVTNLGTILMSATSEENVPAAKTQAERILRQRHRIPPAGEDDFMVRTQLEFAQAASESNRVLTLLLGSIASVSLIVGGIGIMNIMLVSVTERTREVGIRMAVGAREKDILYQFLIEALALSFLGGFLGIALGLSGSKAISFLAGWPTLISPSSIILAFAFSGAVGIFFGIYPARKASKLNPIEALRYE